MNIYWYWPFPARGEQPLAVATVRPGDRLTLHSLASRFGDPIRGQARAYEAIRDLPESPGSRWALPTRLAASLQRIRRRDRLVGSGEFDICHLHSLNHFVDPWALGRLTQPVVATVHDVLPHAFRTPERLERWFLSRLYRTGGTLVVAHELLKRQLLAEFSVDADRVAIIPLPIHGAGEEPAAPTSDPFVLFFGSFRANKGVPVLLEAIRRLPDANDVRFHFAGRGLPAVERHVREASHGDDRITAEIMYISNQRKAELFSKATLVVLPYTSFSSQSGVLHDAYAFRVPVVASDVGALGESVRQDGTGWIVRPNDPDSLSAALAEALDREEARARARAATDRISRERSVRAIGGRLRALYADVLAGRPLTDGVPTAIRTAPEIRRTSARKVQP